MTFYCIFTPISVKLLSEDIGLFLVDIPPASRYPLWEHTPRLTANPFKKGKGGSRLIASMFVCSLVHQPSPF